MSHNPRESTELQTLFVEKRFTMGRRLLAKTPTLLAGTFQWMPLITLSQKLDRKNVRYVLQFNLEF